MAISRADNANVQVTPHATEQVVLNESTVQGQSQKQNTNGQFSWMNAETTSLFSIGRNPQSEVIRAMDAAFEEMKKAAPHGMKVESLVIDRNNNPELQYSVYVLTVVAEVLAEKPVAYHAFLIERSGDPILPEVRTINNQPVEVTHLPSDANDAIMRKIVGEAVLAKYPGRQVIETSAEVVPNCFELNDQDALWRLFINAVLAARKELDQNFNSRDVSINTALKDSSLSIHAERGMTDTTDLSGLPCRTDVLLTTMARSRNNEGGNSMNRQRQAVVSRLGGYIDTIWRRPATMQANQWFGAQPQQQEPIYSPLFVLTTGMPEEVQTLPAQLLTLVSAYMLVEERRWTFGLMPRKGTGKSKEPNLRDIGAIGYDLNPQNNPTGVGEKLEGTDRDDFTLGKLNQLLSLAYSSYLLVALDVPECGSSTWQHAVFSAAAAGNKEAQEAIISAANYLTNGEFAKHWQGGEICYNYGGRIHMGYYLDAERNKRDIRDIDYLAVLNLFGDRDMNVVRGWSESFNNENMPLEVRLQNRKKVYDQFGATLTGYGRRNVFNGNFLQALAAACATSGLSLRPELPFNEQSTDIRTAAGFVNQASVLTPTTTRLFNYGMTTGAYAGSTTNAFTGYVGGSQGFTL